MGIVTSISVEKGYARLPHTSYSAIHADWFRERNCTAQWMPKCLYFMRHNIFN